MIEEEFDDEDEVELDEEVDSGETDVKSDAYRVWMLMFLFEDLRIEHAFEGFSFKICLNYLFWNFLKYFFGLTFEIIDITDI